MLEFLKSLFRRHPSSSEGRFLQTALAGQGRAKEGLRQSEEHFQQLTAGVRDYAIFLLDREGVVSTWNAGAERIKGYRPEEIIGRHFSTFYPKDSVASGWPAHELRVASTTGRFEDEGWRVRKDGSLFWASVVITALRDESGEVRGFLKITRDQTDRKQAEEKLRLSEERFRLLVEGVKDYAIFMLDPQGRVATWNAGAERLKGYSPDEIIGQHFSRFYTQEDLDSGKPARELEIAQTTGKYEEEGWRVRKDGSLFWASVVITALRDQAGVLRGYGKVTRDMTDRKNAEESARRLAVEEAARRAAEEHAAVIQEQGERLRVTLQSIGDGVIVTDADGRVTLLNPVAQSLTGWSGEEAVGEPLKTVFHILNEHSRQPVEDPVAKALRLGRIVGLANHTVMVARDGSERPIDDSAAPLRNERGETVGAVLVFRDVTERRAAESALRIGEERLRLALEAGRMGVWEWNLRTNAVWWSENLEPIHELGGGAAAATPEAFERLIHPDDRDLVRRVASEAVEACSAFEVEFRLVRPDGGVHWMAAKGKVFGGDDGRPLRLIGVGADVTERRRAEHKLREAERRFQAVFNQQFQFMAILSPDGTVLDANDTCFSATGVEKARVMGRLFWETPWWDRLPAARRWWQERVGEIARGGGPAAGDVDYSQADGSTRHADVVLTGLKDDAGRVTSLIVEGRDVTERRRQEEELRASELRWRTLADAVPNLVWSDLPDGQCDWLSGQWRKYTGIPESELLGVRWLETLHPDDRERTLARWTAACADQGEYDLEYRIRRHDGEYRWFKTRGVPIRDAAGKIVYWFGTCTDIEDVKKLEAALREADGRKNEFLATLAHELRNPLAPLRTGLQILQLTRDPAAHLEAAAMMERQLGQMVRLIDDLLDISRISRNKLELRKARIPLASVVENAVETARPLIDAKGQTLTISLPPRPVYFDADLTRLAQVFWNLLNNAAKYTDPGGRIDLAAQLEGEKVVMTVRDTGIGIPAAELPGLFSLFSQVDHSLERAQGGLGIGLALVKGLVEMHGGAVEARSAGVGQGSEFVVRLPVAEGAAETAKAPAASGPDGAARRRILIVDDNRDGAASLGMMLSLLGHDTRTAHDGLEALELAEAFRPEVILLDIGLPKLNGYEAAARIRQAPWGRDVVLVAVTGWGQEEDKRRSKEVGFDFHMVKPVEPAALRKLLASLEHGGPK